jgi:CHAT domain-containing protein
MGKNIVTPHSGLKLAGCNLPRERREDKGVITAEEIHGVDLTNCELAVLSACETNVGLVRTGQGIMSLQRALAIAGAKGSITSLWKVDDQGTMLFFTKFYRLIWEEKMHPAEALRETKLWLKSLTLDDAKRLLADLPGIRERGVTLEGVDPNLSISDHPYAHPFYWASFVFWGKIE